MHALPQSLLSSLGSRDFAASRGNHYASRARQVNISTQANAELTVFTAEGDKVSLMASSAMQAAYASYDYQGRLRGQSLDFHAEELSFGATNEVALLVQGDLNAEELADIQRLVSDIEKIATGFFAGDLDYALVQALDIGDFDSLSRFEATMVLTQQTSVEQLSRARSHKYDAGASQANTITAASVGRLVDEMIQMVKESPVTPGQATSTIPALLTSLFEKLADQHDFDASKRQLATDITSQVAKRIKKPERTDQDTT